MRIVLVKLFALVAIFALISNMQVQGFQNGSDVVLDYENFHFYLDEENPTLTLTIDDFPLLEVIYCSQTAVAEGGTVTVCNQTGTFIYPDQCESINVNEEWHYCADQNSPSSDDWVIREITLSLVPGTGTSASGVLTAEGHTF